MNTLNLPDENFDSWWDNLRATTLVKTYSNDNFPLRVFDVLHFCKHRKIQFIAPQSWDAFVVVSHVWKERIKEWSGPKRAWPSNDKFMRIWAFSEDDLLLLCRILASLDVQYCWIDNICIDQDSKEEKAREIMRMKLYFENTKCYVFPHGIGEIGGPSNDEKWYSRVWTLQEMIVNKNSEYVYIVSDDSLPIKCSKEIHADVGKGMKVLSVQYTDVYNFVKDAPYTNILWKKDKLTKLEILRLAGTRNATYEEDKIYSLLGLLNINNIDIKYGSGLKSAVVSVAQSMHIDERIMLCIIEFAGSGWVDGYSMIPSMLPEAQAWGMDISQTVGHALFLGDRGTEITSFISNDVLIEELNDRCVEQFRVKNMQNCREIMMDIQPDNPRPIGNTRIIGYGKLSCGHNANEISKFIIIGRCSDLESNIEELNDKYVCPFYMYPASPSMCVVVIVCQRAGDVWHKTGVCAIQPHFYLTWRLGRTIVA